MNKRAYIFCLIVFIIGFSMAYIVGIKIGSEEGESLKEKVVNVSPDSEKKETEAEGYWVKAQDDKIIVYKKDGSTVVAHTDIKISRLSDREQRILENGIYLESAEELFKFLEANTS